MTSIQDFDPGSVCAGCPHALDDHDVKFGLGATSVNVVSVVLVCELCNCHLAWRPGRALEDASFNQEAQNALGSQRKSKEERTRD